MSVSERIPNYNQQNHFHPGKQKVNLLINTREFTKLLGNTESDLKEKQPGIMHKLYL